MNEERKILVEEVEAVEKPKLAKVEDAVDTPDKPAPVMAPSPFEAESDSAKLNRKKDYLEGFLAQKPAEATAGTPDNNAIVTMTLTTPHCPVAESMPGEIEMQVGSVPGVGHAEVNLVWDPPWDPGKMSDEAKLELGML